VLPPQKSDAATLPRWPAPSFPVEQALTAWHVAIRRCKVALKTHTVTVIVTIMYRSQIQQPDWRPIKRNQTVTVTVTVTVTGRRSPTFCDWLARHSLAPMEVNILLIAVHEWVLRSLAAVVLVYLFASGYQGVSKTPTGPAGPGADRTVTVYAFYAWWFISRSRGPLQKVCHGSQATTASRGGSRFVPKLPGGRPKNKTRLRSLSLATNARLEVAPEQQADPVQCPGAG